MSPEGLTDLPKVFSPGNLHLHLGGHESPWHHLRDAQGPIFDHPTLPSFILHLGNRELGAFVRVGNQETDLPYGKGWKIDYVDPSLPGLKLIERIGPGPRPHTIHRQFDCQTLDDFQPLHGPNLLQWRLILSGLGIGQWAASKVSVPMARMLPSHPISRVIQRPRTFPPDTLDGEFEDLGVAPDCGLGAVLMSLEDSTHHFALIPLADESPLRTFIFGHQNLLAVEHVFQKEIRLAPGQIHRMGTQILLSFSGERQDFLREVSRIYTHSYPPPQSSSRPAWAGTATVLEADFVHYGGIAGLTEKLPALKDQGFDTVYLMPWHTGPYSGYGTLDYWEIDPAKGTFEDLQKLTRRAHDLGLKVLFDLLVNMVTEKSRYLSENPDWFYRDEEGTPQRHTVWPGFALDPASIGFRRFLRDYCLRCVTELGADGFRVDAVSYRGGNWNPLTGLQPHQHAHAIFTLLAEIRTAIQSVKPEAILMAECFGPIQVPVSDLVCYQWVGWLDWVLQNLIEQKLTGQQLGLLLQDHFGCMPRGTWLTTYTHTHDTVAFQGREWEGEPVNLLFALLHLASAGIMTFGGGWNMRERPGSGEIAWQRKLARLKHETGTVASHEIWFQKHHHPNLLIFERPSQLGKLRICANFSAADQPWIPQGSLLFTSREATPQTDRLHPWEFRVENLS